MKKFLQAISILIGIVLGIYVGLWLLFIGGITQVVHGLNPVNAMDIAIGITRIIFAPIGWLIIGLGAIIAEAIKGVKRSSFIYFGKGE